jgi:hypothetical protein
MADDVFSDIEVRISACLAHGGPPVVFGPAASGVSVRVRAVRTSAPGRPDGLRDDVAGDPGFSFEAALAQLEIDVPGLSPAERSAVHERLWLAGTDDWMDYSHLGTYDGSGIAEDDTLALQFSSAAKGARVVADVCKLLKIDPRGGG